MSKTRESNSEMVNLPESCRNSQASPLRSDQVAEDSDALPCWSPHNLSQDHLSENEFLNENYHPSFKKKTVQIVSSIFNEEMLSTLKEHFDSIDIDNSGQIDAEELEQLYTNLGIQATPQQLEDMILRADKDNNKSIDFEEFIRALEGEDSSVRTVEETCNKVWPEFSQGSDRVTAAHIFDVCKRNKGTEEHITMDECREMIRAIKEVTEDETVDESISQEQFQKIMEYDFSH